MVKFPPPSRARRPRGIALVIVLCFVVLVTGLVVAYFSRSITVRQLANSSTSATQADLLAQNAADLIAGDFKQEIVAGSLPAVTPSPSPASGTLYFPSQAIYAVPQRNLPTPTPATGSSPAVGPMPNLVRRSLRNDAAAVPAPGLTSRASAAASDTPSANGRSVSATRWNRHGLLPAAAVSPSPAPFSAPDWVMVTAEHGPEVITSPTRDANGPVTVVGRYAYAVYDEGGLLDANHAGFPSTSTFAQVGSKLPPGYADLTQLPSPSPASSLALLTPTVVDNLLGWRNNATLGATGTLPFPTFTPLPSSAASAYNSYLMANTLNPGQVPTTYVNGRTDQMFLSRQQLIGYFSAANLDPSYLQYLTTFSRGLNQPSYAPEPTRPTPAPAAVGGNDSNGNAYLNPSFLTVRATSAFTRNDGTTAVVGEPLVKKRFALNRIAWLTFRGPIADASGNLNPNGDVGVAAMITAYNNAGISTNFLQQGTTANILKYFGLQYGSVTDSSNVSHNAWIYMHGQSGKNGAIVNLSNSTQATDVVRLGREPDFFELLKAAVNAGSIAKSSLTPSPGTNPPTVAAAGYSSYVFAADLQYNTDSSLDTAILQMGANIIDQFDADNYPTTIAFDLKAAGSYANCVYGVENLPYILRVRPSLIRLQEANPPENQYDPPALSTPYSNDKLLDTGVAALMNLPEIWNPHDYGNTGTAAGLQQVMGVAGPQNFQIYAVTRNNYPIAVCADLGAGGTFGKEGVSPSCNAVAANSPGFFATNKISFGTTDSGQGGESRSLTQANTLMTFKTPSTPAGAALFREPTILFQPGLPAGSSLTSTPLTNANPKVLGNLAAGTAFFSNSGLFGRGLLSAVTSAASPAHPRHTTNPSTPYIGFYLGIHPLRWYVNSPGYNSYQNLAAAESVFGGSYEVTFTLACEDGNGGYIPYDNKLLSTVVSPNGVLNNSSVSPTNSSAYPSYERCFGLDGGFTSAGGSDRYLHYYEVVDPRTSRFGLMESYIDGNTEVIPPYSGYGWVDSSNNVMLTSRSTNNSGRSMYRGSFLSAPYATYPSMANTSPWFAPGSGWYHNSVPSYLKPDAFRPGLVCSEQSQHRPGRDVRSGRPRSRGHNELEYDRCRLHSILLHGSGRSGSSSLRRERACRHRHECQHAGRSCRGFRWRKHRCERLDRCAGRQPTGNP